LLSKIHLKTACNCECSYFDTIHHGSLPSKVRVPIKATVIPWKAGRIAPMVACFRIFRLVKCEGKSSRRIELWYEEEVIL
jgi:hypothetical protein